MRSGGLLAERKDKCHGYPNRLGEGDPAYVGGQPDGGGVAYQGHRGAFGDGALAEIESDVALDEARVQVPGDEQVVDEVVVVRVGQARVQRHRVVGDGA